MKKILMAILLLIGTVHDTTAQEIAVVNGSTLKTCTTLLQAVRNATDGSIIYLSAGGFQIGDTVRITHRVSIIGLNHKAKSDNADGMTSISGSLYFDEGSDGSIVMGCYISGNVMIGYDDKAVHNIFVRYCNLNAVQVKSNLCTGTTVNQSYIRNTCSFNGAPAILTNNVMNGTSGLNGGLVDYNVVRGSIGCSSTTITNNVLLSTPSSYSGPTSNNMTLNTTWGDNPLKVEAASWNDVFENPDPGISSRANYHFKEGYEEYEYQVGIYGGKRASSSVKYFHDDALPPVPYINAKTVPESTDFDGMLKVSLTVKDGNK